MVAVFKSMFSVDRIGGWDMSDEAALLLLELELDVTECSSWSGCTCREDDDEVVVVMSLMSCNMLVLGLSSAIWLRTRWGFTAIQCGITESMLPTVMDASKDEWTPTKLLLLLGLVVLFTLPVSVGSCPDVLCSAANAVWLGLYRGNGMCCCLEVPVPRWKRIAVSTLSALRWQRCAALLVVYVQVHAWLASHKTRIIWTFVRSSLD